jgi:hypothetical protein
MMHLRDRLTYANITATLALVAALGGTSYAAFTLPRNSVGPRQIRRGAVRSAQVKNGSLSATDLSARARRTLRGNAGPAGPIGPQGPTGAAAAGYLATVSAAGERVAGNSTGGGRQTAVGTYPLAFSRSLSGCAVTATLGTPDSSTTVPGRITVNVVNGQAGVQTYAADGSPANLPFHLIAAC